MFGDSINGQTRYSLIRQIATETTICKWQEYNKVHDEYVKGISEKLSKI